MSDQAISTTTSIIMKVIILAFLIIIMVLTIEEGKKNSSEFSEDFKPLGNNVKILDSRLICDYDGIKTNYIFSIYGGRVVSKEKINDVVIIAHIGDKLYRMEPPGNIYNTGKIRGEDLTSEINLEFINEDLPVPTDTIPVSVWNSECTENYIDSNSELVYSDILEECPDSYIKLENVKVLPESSCFAGHNPDSSININSFECPLGKVLQKVEIDIIGGIALDHIYSCVYDNTAKAIFLDKRNDQNIHTLINSVEILYKKSQFRDFTNKDLTSYPEEAKGDNTDRKFKNDRCYINSVTRMDSNDIYELTFKNPGDVLSTRFPNIICDDEGFWSVCDETTKLGRK